MMKVLLLHNEDVPWRGPWASIDWELIIDLGFAAPSTYKMWSERCGTPVRSIHEFARDGQSYASIPGILDLGRDRLVDRTGLDWWEIIGVVKYHELRAFYLLKCLTRELGSNAVYHATRGNSYTELLGGLMGRPIPRFQAAPGFLERWTRSLRSAVKLSPANTFEIACDKWDPDYSVRRQFAKARRASVDAPTVLLPSAYSNVSRLLLQYAADLPEKPFLLAATRRSGTSAELPGNVRQTFLSAYAQAANAVREEEKELGSRWARFERTVLTQTVELRASRAAGVWQEFPVHLQTGLRLRDAWHTLLKEEPITAVLCADDLNYYTRIPLILAARMGLNAVYCYHGALDGGLLFKKAYAGSYLVKTEMEREYLLRASKIDPELVEIGAPASFVSRLRRNRQECGRDIVFFSQKYEVMGGRTAEIYRDVMPNVCALATGTGRRVMVKLHPFENVRDRERVLRSVLSDQQISLVKITAEPLLEQVLTDAWCGIGVDSSVAAECRSAGVPYFLCGWLDHSGFGYSRQLARFGMGRMLDSPSELDAVPEMIADWSAWAQPPQVSEPVDSKVLERMLFGTSEVSVKQCAS
jgi:hypothetical protein